MPKSERWMGWMLLAMLTLVYAPIVFTSYLTSDCAAFFDGRNDHGIFLKIVGDGRPILAFIYEHSIRALSVPSDVRLLRIIYLLLLLIFAATLFRHKRKKRSLHFRFALTFLMLTSPGMLEKASLTPSYMTPLAASSPFFRAQ